MRKELTTEEWTAKRQAAAAEQRKKVKPPPERKEAGVTAYRKFTEISSNAVYRSAHPDPKGYKQYFAPEMTALDLGREARAALMASRFITPDHPEWDAVMRIPTDVQFKAWQEEDKARAGVKTLKALFNGAGFVSFRLQEGQIKIVPWHHRSQGHWEGVRGVEATVLPEDVTDEAFGAAILAALEVSRNL
jgi:CDI immunity protein